MDVVGNEQLHFIYKNHIVLLKSHDNILSRIKLIILLCSSIYTKTKTEQSCFFRFNFNYLYEMFDMTSNAHISVYTIYWYIF